VGGPGESSGGVLAADGEYCQVSEQAAVGAWQQGCEPGSDSVGDTVVPTDAGESAEKPDLDGQSAQSFSPTNSTGTPGYTGLLTPPRRSCTMTTVTTFSPLPSSLLSSDTRRFARWRSR
jgi:hypothetical protein